MELGGVFGGVFGGVEVAVGWGLEEVGVGGVVGGGVVGVDEFGGTLFFFFCLFFRGVDWRVVGDEAGAAAEVLGAVKDKED